MEPAPTTLGEFIKQARKARGLTQVRVAELCEVSPGLVSRWESQERGLSQEQARALWSVLNLDAAERVMVTTLPGAR